MSENFSDDSARKFLHLCRGCQKSYRVSIKVNLYSIHRASCPHCNRTNYFDNRDGRLEKSRWQSRTRYPDAATTRIEKPTDIIDTPLPVATKKIELNRLSNEIDGSVFSSDEKVPYYKRKKRAVRESIFYELSSKFDFLFKFDRLKMVLIGSGILMILLFVTVMITIRFPSLYLKNAPEFYLKRLKAITANRILDRRGELIGELFSRKTGNLKANEIPEQIRKNIIFIEDQNFYTHGGVDWLAVFRAFITNIFAVGYKQGGSSISQQLARILIVDRSKTIIRKLRETSLAYFLENIFTKEEILTAYLNHVYLGHGALGIESAARFYFNKKPDELDFVESLIITALPSAPEFYSPLRNPRLLEKKLDAVYERMRENNLTDLSPVLYNSMKINVFQNIRKGPRETIFGNRVNTAPYVVEYVRLHLKQILGNEFEYSAGLVIETTIDKKLQTAAARESKEHMKYLSSWIRPKRMRDGKIIAKRNIAHEIANVYDRSQLGLQLFGLPSYRSEKNVLQTASIGLNPKTGEILFMQGGTEFSPGNQFNRAISMRRQTGSSIKPIIYSAAIESRVLTAASRLDDKPIYTIQKKRKKNDLGYWLPANYSGVYEGTVSVRRALAHSKNIPAIQVVRRIGMQRIAQQFRKFFFQTEKIFNQRFRFDETVAIGSLEMSPLEMAVAFGAFGNNGVIVRPYLIRKIINVDGKILYSGEEKDEFHMQMPRRKRVISGSTAHIMFSIMRDSGKRGGVYRGGFRGGPFIGKTGTTNEFRDAWFVGIVPGLSAAVWVGYDNPAYSMYRATGATAAGPLWGRIVSSGMSVRGSFIFSPRAIKVLICDDSGFLSRSGCPRKRNELFIKETIPTEKCQIHLDNVAPKTYQNYSINRNTDFD